MKKFSRTEALIFALVAWPFLMALMSSCGFVLGVTVGRWQILLSFLVVAGLGCWMSGTHWRRFLWWYCMTCLGPILLSSVSVMYTNADAEVYHRAGSILLSKGWNPVYCTEIRDVGKLADGGVRVWHLAYLPRAAWIFGAGLYRIFGFVEVADSLNVIATIAAFLSVRKFLSENTILGVWLRRIAAVVLTLSPTVIAGMFGGSFDCAWMGFFIVAVASAADHLKSGSRRMLPVLAMSIVMTAGIKYTGVVVGVVIFVVYGGVLLFKGFASVRALFITGVATGVLILIGNISPYVTSWIKHGGPFYPAHTFVASERVDDPLTYDFGDRYMNADARAMGYVGRFLYAYVSQDICGFYYRHHLKQVSFNPDFKVSGGVGGFGPVFRFAFVLSLILWPLVRNKQVHVLSALILFTVLIQPTYYSGYARYVSQFYLFPFLIGIGLVERFKRNVVIAAVLGAGGVLCAATCAYPASFYLLQWLISVQNLQVIAAARSADSVPTWASSYYSRVVLSEDSGVKCRFVDRSFANGDSQKHEIGSYFRFYKMWMDHPVDDWYSLAHVLSGNDPSIKANRNKENIRFFIHVFLPKEIKMLPCRVSQLLKLRANQVRGVWR